MAKCAKERKEAGKAKCKQPKTKAPASDGREGLNDALKDLVRKSPDCVNVKVTLDE